MKKAVLQLMVVILVLSLIPSLVIASSSHEKQSEMPYSIMDWTLDEQAGYLYAITDARIGEVPKLLFIDTDDLSIKKELDIGTEPFNIVKYQDKLYITFWASKQIVVVDSKKQEIIQTYTAKEEVDNIAVDENKLYYITIKGQLYVLDLVSNQQEKIQTEKKSFSSSGLLIDSKKKILYIGEISPDYGNVFAIKLSDYSTYSRSTVNDGHGVGNRSKKMFLSKGDLFYAGRKFDANKLEIIHGEYYEGTNNEITAVNDKYVVDMEAVYDRDRFVKIMELPGPTRMVQLGSSNQLYLYRGGKLTKEKIANLELPSTKTDRTDRSLWLNQELTSWIYDEGTQRIYAVSKQANRLYVINPSKMSLEKEIYIGSKPTDIKIIKNKLYIALFGSTKIAEVDTKSINKVKYIVTSTNPYQIAGTKDKLFYAAIDQFYTDQVKDVFVYDFKLKKNRKTGIDESNPRIQIDDKSNQIFVGGKNSLKYYRVSDYELVGQVPIRVFDPFILDGENLYFEKVRFTINDFTKYQTKYPEPVIYAKEEFVFSNMKIFNRETGKEVVKLPELVSNVLMVKKGEVYLYSKRTKKITRYKSIEEIQKAK